MPPCTCLSQLSPRPSVRLPMRWARARAASSPVGPDPVLSCSQVPLLCLLSHPPCLPVGYGCSHKPSTVSTAQWEGALRGKGCLSTLGQTFPWPPGLSVKTVLGHTLHYPPRHPPASSQPRSCPHRGVACMCPTHTGPQPPTPASTSHAASPPERDPRGQVLCLCMWPASKHSQNSLSRAPEHSSSPGGDVFGLL